MDITDTPMQSVNIKFRIIPVPKECNMIDFAKENFEKYDPDSGYGYYQFTEGTEEYISPKTRVLLISKVSEYVVFMHARYLFIPMPVPMHRTKGEHVLIVKHVK